MTMKVLRSLKTIAQRLTLLIMTVVMLLNLTQSPAFAVADRYEKDRVAVPGITEPASEQSIDELREQRREWQSRASAIHSANDEMEEPDSVGEAIGKKLNLDEIKQGHYDPQRETEKAYQRDPLGSR